MKNTISNIEEPLTPEMVLAILRDSYNQQCQYDPEAEPGMELSFETTIEEWRCACDLVEWKPLSKAMNKWFQIDLTEEQWKEVLEPAEIKNLLGVCKLISSTATRPAVLPLNIFGSSCLEAGAFVTLRTALANAGIPVESLHPSTQLHPWLLKYWKEFSDIVGKIAPEALPPVEIEEAAIKGFGYKLFGLGIVTELLSFIINYGFIHLISIAALLSGVILILFTLTISPKRVSYGKLETIGDVCRLISVSVEGRDKRIIG